MPDRTRRTPGVGGRGSVQQNNSLDDSNRDRTPVRGILMRLTSDHEADASALVEQVGPVSALRLAYALVECAGSINETGR